jgi:hypothetical protein
MKPAEDRVLNAMELLQAALVQCPYCWEQVDLLVDCTVEEQEYVEDCSVCCQPMVISVVVSEDGEPVAEARME